MDPRGTGGAAAKKDFGPYLVRVFINSLLSGSHSLSSVTRAMTTIGNHLTPRLSFSLVRVELERLVSLVSEVPVTKSLFSRVTPPDTEDRTVVRDLVILRQVRRV